MKFALHSKHIFVKFSIIFFLVTFYICTYFILHDFLQYKENNKYTEKLIEDVIQPNNTIIEKNNIDWEHLKSINPDIIGWIEIEGTKVNYPILQDNNDLYYLKHSFNKQYNNNGSIFTINKNAFLDDETTIYGHNMKNGTMFSILSKYLNSDFLNEHLNFKIYTPTVNYDCTIFSVYSIGVETEDNNISKLNFNERIEYYKKASKYKLNNIDNCIKIVKLSTCSYINAKTIPTDQRYYIIANIIPIYK